MKKTFKILALLIGVVLLLCLNGCGESKPEKVLYGLWSVEENGVAMTVSFSEDNVMTVVSNLVDKAVADEAGVNPEIVKTKNIVCYYSVEKEPDISRFSEAEQEILSGKMALTSYLNEEDMKNSFAGETIYFVIEGDSLITTQRTGTFDSQTNIPEYSETVFKKQK